jgi:chromosome partitioning protein
MKTLAVVSQKGGCGKTTLSVHLAVCAVQAGKTVALIDIDFSQGNCVRWYETRDKQNELVATKAKAAELPELLRLLKKGGADLVIIDTAPHTDDEAAAAAKLADFVLVPSRPARFDLEAIPSTMDIVRLTKTPAAIVINAAPRGPTAKEAQEALKAQGYPVLDNIIYNRVAYNYAVTDGRSVHEYEPEGKAAAEVGELYKILADTMKI